MQSMINKSFENLAQRSIYYFLATYPSFYSINSTDASTAYELKRNYGPQKLLAAWRIDCSSAVELGIKLFNEDVLEKLREKANP